VWRPYGLLRVSDSTVRIGVARGGGGVDWRASPPRCGQLTRCFSAVAELLVGTTVAVGLLGDGYRTGVVSLYGARIGEMDG